MSLHAAVDFGASSGRVMLGAVGPGRLRLTEAARFRNGAVEVPGERGAALHWDVLGLWRESLAGLRQVGALARAAGEPVASVGVATWAVDYGLLAADGTLLGAPRSYRDARTDGVAERVHQRLPAVELYRRNGLQHLPFTTLYQLVAEQDGPLLAAARNLLLVPDLVGYWLSGHLGAEATNVSTTGLADVRTGRWAEDLVALAGIDAGLLPPVHDPGAVLGGLRPAVTASTGLDDARLVAVGSHDTASAVVGVPATDERFAYVACGTWALVGVELEAPVLGAESLAAGFTNERGVDDRIRYLHNVMGLWVLQGCLADWGLDSADLTALLAAAAELPAGGAVVDVDDPAFLPPGPMVTRVQQACEAAGQPVPVARPAVVRCVLDSLATAFARVVEDAVRLSGRDVDVVHVVGGGAQNALLCQLTADACGRPVLAGPVEATALGNVLVQARAAGAVTGALEDLRALVAATSDLVRYVPGG
ncbi:Rhamnulokinase [Modestobacter italicus]|uniref:Rhamnulokinase n=1 Tax=Modestobacter italicus (strain DSM 44449 / CECT 9708 / BC 501) TaxID=2732864 RepID=I4F5E2_MODI5|nr:rhamnulokinase family protein [Modestobacter marinus]CCH90855.1 Rhamnulokinase [Modestobacter marinus]